MKIINLEQGSKEWLDFRDKKIGASDVPIILGISPYSTPLELWKRKIGFSPALELNFAMKFGRDNESRVRELMNIALDEHFEPVVVQHEKEDWAIASLDGISKDLTKIIEIKCCGFADHELAKQSIVPEKYFPQVQWQMFVTGCRELYYCSFYKEELIFFKVEYDVEFIDKCFLACSDFNHRLLDYVPPLSTLKDRENIESDDFAIAASDYIKARETLKEAEKQEKYYKEKLLEFAKDKNRNLEGFGLKLSIVEKKGNVKWEKITKKYEIPADILDSYREESKSHWKITIDKS